MEFEIRSVFLVVGLLVIAAILIHGLMSIRHANKPVDLSGIDLSDEDKNGDPLRDRSGFDRHGVGVARKINQQDESQPPTFSEPQDATRVSEEVQLDLDLPLVPPLDGNEIDFDVALTTEPPLVSDDLTIIEARPPVFDSPITSKKQTVELAIPPVNTELEQVIEPQQPELAEPMDVLVLNVVANESDELSGAELLPILLTLGFKFGEMNIFHRHSSSAGHGEVLFSLANMVKPGTFDIDNMEQFTTTGISLFMTLPHNNGNLDTFNLMLNAAAKIAEELSGQVLDGNRSTLTNQLTRHYVERIREVERKLLVKNK